MEINIAQAPGYEYFVKRFGDTFGPARVKRILENEVPDDRRVADYLVNALPGEYDRTAACVLSAASTWAYSDADTLARMLRLRGIPNNHTVSITLNNEALFLETTAHVVASNDGRLVILCFGGTRPTNAVDLLLDASVDPDSFFGWGSVHGGFFRAFEALWALPKILIEGAARGMPLPDWDYALTYGHRSRSVFEKDEVSDGWGELPLLEHRDHDMKALYITGHSLGGALAVLAAAAIHTDPELTSVKDVLRGVYTFGQPMVGDEIFKSTFAPMFGESLFRHVYADDPVPHLPPKSTGTFTHFGNEYRASKGTPWQLSKQNTTQAWNAPCAALRACLGWLQDQFPGPPLSWLPGAYSCIDHVPLAYLRASLKSVPSEFGP